MDQIVTISTYSGQVLLAIRPTLSNWYDVVELQGRGISASTYLTDMLAYTDLLWYSLSTHILLKPRPRN